MDERNRQFMIFGDFSHIDIESVVERLAGIVEEYDYRPGFAPDIAAAAGIIPHITRRALYSRDGNEMVIFGDDYICMQENLSDTSSYDAFLAKNSGIAKEMICKLDLEIKRLACNGSIINYSVDHAKDVYSKIFNPESFIYDKNANEWNFMMNKQIFVEELGRNVNQILRVVRGDNITGTDGAVAKVLALVYDYNTSPTENEVFDDDDIDTFIDHARNFKQKTLAL